VLALASERSLPEVATRLRMTIRLQMSVQIAALLGIPLIAISSCSPEEMEYPNHDYDGQHDYYCNSNQQH
jgi:hypothetical protein